MTQYFDHKIRLLSSHILSLPLFLSVFFCFVLFISNLSFLKVVLAALSKSPSSHFPAPVSGVLYNMTRTNTYRKIYMVSSCWTGLEKNSIFPSTFLKFLLISYWKIATEEWKTILTQEEIITKLLLV